MQLSSVFILLYIRPWIDYIHDQNVAKWQLSNFAFAIADVIAAGNIEICVGYKRGEKVT